MCRTYYIAACLSLSGCCLSFYSDCVGIRYVHKVCRPIFYMQTKCQNDEYTLHVCMIYVFIVMHCGVLKY